MLATQKRPVAYETKAALALTSTGDTQSVVDDLYAVLRHSVIISLPSLQIPGWTIPSIVGAGSLIFQGQYAEVTNLTTGASSGAAGAGTTATSLVKPTGAGNWTASNLRGRQVKKVLTGEVRTIRDNTTTAATIESLPGLTAGDSFIICEPSSEITSTITAEGCTCPIEFRGVKLSADLLTNENRKVSVSGSLLSGGNWVSTYDGMVSLQNSVIKNTHHLQATDSYRAIDVSKCYLLDGELRIWDCANANVQGEARSCTGNALHLVDVQHARVDMLASSNSATPFVLEGVHRFEAVGTDKLTGSGNTGWGVSINTAGRYRLIGCTVTGSLGDIDFDGEALTWGNLGSSTYGAASKFGCTLIGESGENKCIEYKSKTFLETVEVSGRLLTYGFHNMSQVTGLTAAGSSASDALQLTQYVYNRVDTVAAGTGVKMTNGALIPGVLAIIHNNGANTLKIYPYSGGTIDGAASINLAAGARIPLVSSSGDGLSWVSF